MKKVIPNGAIISEIRKDKEMKQDDFASRVGISVRKLRDIETRNLPISPSALAEFADKLGVGVERLIASGSEPVVPSSTTIQLRPVTGRELFDAIRWAEDLQYEVFADIQTPHLEAVLDILAVSAGFVKFHKGGEFPTVAMMNSVAHMHDQFGTPGMFEDVKMIAALNELISRLRGHGIAIFANTYKFGEQYPPATCAALAFAGIENDVVDLQKSNYPF